MSGQPPERSPGRRRLARALGGRPTRGQGAAAVLLALLGFAMVVQARTTQEAGLEGLRQNELVRVLDDTTGASDRLRAELAQLEETRRELGSGSDGSRTAVEEAQRRAETLGILAGTLPAEGPGIVLRLEDESGGVRYDLLLDAVQELRDAGAEAIQVGDVRVVASTWFLDGEDGGIVVDGTLLTPPYELRAIGDPATLEAALGIPGGILDRLPDDEESGTVRREDRVAVTALREPQEPEYARPAPEEDGSEGSGDSDE